MHTKTLEDLANIKKIDGKISELRKSIINIKNECHHLDRKPTLIETMAWENTPALECLVCGDQKYGDNILTADQMRELYKEEVFCKSCEDLLSFCDCGEDNSKELSDFVKDNPRGFNYPRMPY